MKTNARNLVSAGLARYGRLWLHPPDAQLLDAALAPHLADPAVLAVAQAEQTEWPPGMDIDDEVARRQERLARLAEAKAVLELRAQARYEAE